MRNTYSDGTGVITSLLTERDRPETMLGSSDKCEESIVSRSHTMKCERRVA